MIPPLYFLALLERAVSFASRQVTYSELVAVLLGGAATYWFHESAPPPRDRRNTLLQYDKAPLKPGRAYPKFLSTNILNITAHIQY